MKKWTLIISLSLNIIFILGFLLNRMNSPTHELGRLEQDIEVGIFTTDTIIFKLPKGLTVRNKSERGIAAIGQFENERFEIVITSEDPTLVNYQLPEDSLHTFGNYYSGNINKWKE